MNKILGIFGLLLFVCLFTTVMSDSFVGAYNLYNITRWSALFGILSVGVAFVIITGGIDLSIGSVVGLIACLLPMLVVDFGVSPIVACLAVMLVAGGIGLLHGFLITRMELQPFVVTLCGLLFYRGFARWLTDDATLGFGQDYDQGLRLLAIGKPCSWATMLIGGGVCLALYGFWKAMKGSSVVAIEPNAATPSEMTSGDLVGVETAASEMEPSGDRLAERLRRWSLPAIGCVLAAVGASRFAMGWQPTDAVVLFEAMGYQIKGLGVELPEGAAELPSLLMRYIGLGLLVPMVGLFLGWALLGNAQRVRRPIIMVASTLLLLVGCIWKLVPWFREVSPNDLWQVGAVQISGGLLKMVLMLICFLVVGSAIGSIGWLISAAGSASERSKSLVPLLVTSCVLALLGFTNLAGTMVPMPMLFLIGLAVAASIFLNQTVYGRYLLALGRNEEAALYSGINTKRMVVVAYVLCSLAAGLGGILFALDVNSVQPAGFGNFYELYAIAAAVLGGCSLRGGEGNILGVVIGAAVMRVLYNSINILGISTQLEFAIIGLVILAGVMVDVVVKRIVARRAVIGPPGA